MRRMALDNFDSAAFWVDTVLVIDIGDQELCNLFSESINLPFFFFDHGFVMDTAFGLIDFLIEQQDFIL